MLSLIYRANGRSITNNFWLDERAREMRCSPPTFSNPGPDPVPLWRV